MKETYEYILSDVDNKSYNIKCKAEYNTENDYDTTYYFFDGDTWHKDFIDLNKISPENKEGKDKFEDFITRIHDYMVHGNLWKELKAMNDHDEISKEQYKLNIIANKL